MGLEERANKFGMMTAMIVQEQQWLTLFVSQSSLDFCQMLQEGFFVSAFRQGNDKTILQASAYRTHHCSCMSYLIDWNLNGLTRQLPSASMMNA